VETTCSRESIDRMILRRFVMQPFKRPLGAANMTMTQLHMVGRVNDDVANVNQSSKSGVVTDNHSPC
jgi:hypothetical protein